MNSTGYMIGGIVLLLVGIGLAIVGYNLEPTAGEAIGNIFSGDFTDKRNLLMFAGIALAVVGAASLIGSVFVGKRAVRA